MRLAARLGSVVVFIFVFGGAATSADYRLLRLDGDLVKWGQPQLGTGATITYAFAERLRWFSGARNCRSMRPLRLWSRHAEIPIAAVEREFRRALAAWEQVINVRFRRVRDGAQANILVGAQAQPRGRAFANVMPSPDRSTERGADGPAQGRAAIAWPQAKAGAEDSGVVSSIQQSLICLNAERPWKLGFDGDLDVYDLRYTFTHELGHALGLDHPGATGELMSFRYEEKFRSLQGGDIAGAVNLYGPGGGSCGTDCTPPWLPVR